MNFIEVDKEIHYLTYKNYHEKIINIDIIYIAIIILIRIVYYKEIIVNCSILKEVMKIQLTD